MAVIRELMISSTTALKLLNCAARVGLAESLWQFAAHLIRNDFLGIQAHHDSRLYTAVHRWKDRVHSSLQPGGCSKCPEMGLGSFGTAGVQRGAASGLASGRRWSANKDLSEENS